ncbi:DUF4395 domain-containing protein [Demequina sp. TTPB684]|uniref:DUF4395 domain-containing protein n=1 Tax=unclassified Demequina TaxID=2620311 RepID=UPI001CF298CE|nr:DUF4395 domain-containing protein [Demequina sp. TMPB413]MCB2413222.1 DUF4395 domain-containing protein [Demequina sp. TTPB684]UPU88203.1 DUF4395 domain-containing protein [Demequina sp. TMPB413]
MSPTSDVQIDPRGYRFGALVTFAVVLAALLVGANTAGIILMAVLTAMFLPGATVGPQMTVQSWLFRTFVRPRIGPPAATESFRPPRFAQQMGLAMAAAGLILGLVGADAGFYVFAALVAIASFLNGVFGFCAGCEIYLLMKRATSKAV